MNGNYCLFSDSFPPIIDGVSNVVRNYAEKLAIGKDSVTIVAPQMPLADDSVYPFSVFRYQSIALQSTGGYPLGIPYSPALLKQLKANKPTVLHSHCPTSCLLLARTIRKQLDIPIILSYHTKYDIEIEQHFRTRFSKKVATTMLQNNIASCDEVWVVSKGAEENLRKIGFKGEVIYMPNGVDYVKKERNNDAVSTLLQTYGIPENVPLFLYVGRIKWYKGLKIIIDALKIIESSSLNYRMVFIGEGADKPQVMEYIHSLGLSNNICILNAITDRDLLQRWYWSASLFLFPSSFDTDGLVVKEAAACYLPSILVNGSSAAEKIIDGVNGFLIEATPEALAAKLSKLATCPEAIKAAGNRAADTLYLSWDDAISRARMRYDYVSEHYYSNNIHRRN